MWTVLNAVLQDVGEPGMDMGNAALDAESRSQDLLYRIQNNPMFIIDDHDAAGSHPGQAASGKARSSVGGVRFREAPVLSRANHVDQSSSGSEDEVQQRALFRQLLNGIRFKVSRMC